MEGVYCITLLDDASILKISFHSSSIFHISLEMPLFIDVLSMEEDFLSSMHLPYLIAVYREGDAFYEGKGYHLRVVEISVIPPKEAS